MTRTVFSRDEVLKLMRESYIEGEHRCGRHDPKVDPALAEQHLTAYERKPETVIVDEQRFAGS